MTHGCIVETSITSRERDIITRLCEGMKGVEVVKALGISNQKALSNALQRLRQKLGYKTSLQMFYDLGTRVFTIEEENQ